jgi:hypothetical protein
MRPPVRTCAFSLALALVAACSPFTLAAGAAVRVEEHVLTGSVVLVDRTWNCNGRVDLSSVTVTITRAVIGERRLEDAVHLRPGCTGRIGRIDVTQSAGDGVKVAEGVHDLEIDGGRIRCLAKAPNLHQDGIQVMGGERISFRNMTIDCGRAADTLIDSNFFVKRAGRSSRPPADVTCDHCNLGGWTAHTVNIQASVRSGVTNSRVCVGRYPRLTFTKGADAIHPVDSANTVAGC